MADSTDSYVQDSYERDTDYITDRIVRSPDGDGQWPVEAGRYRLVGAHACPWANRAIITRRLLGLESAIGLGLAGPIHDADSWTFDLDPGEVDPVLGIPKLKDAYLNRFPDYPKGITVPALVEVDTVRVVTNDYAQITLDLNTEWREFHRPGAPDLFPERHRDEILEVSDSFYEDLNNGVYKCGFAGQQSAYESAYDDLWACMDRLSERLEGRRYLVGDTITEADIRLWVSLVRFDAVYHGHFKANRSKLAEMPVLWAYARDLFQTPGFGDTQDFVRIKQHYYGTHLDINPTGVVPLGPDERVWAEPHDRASLGGRPFGDGTPPARAVFGVDDVGVDPAHNRALALLPDA